MKMNTPVRLRTFTAPKFLKSTLYGLILIIGLALMPSCRPLTVEQGRQLSDEDVAILLEASVTSDELIQQIKAKGYSGVSDISTLKRLREKGASAELLTLLRQSPSGLETPAPAVTEPANASFQNTLGMQMIWVGPGQMERLLQVTQDAFTNLKVTEGYYIGSKEVSQQQWKTIQGTDPSFYKGDDLPVELITAQEAQQFCTRLTEREKAAGRLPQGYVYRLPTEVQWEYAARAGDRALKPTTLAEFAWHNEEPFADDSVNHPVGSKKPNAWGFYDMLGNVAEHVMTPEASDSSAITRGAARIRPVGSSDEDFSLYVTYGQRSEARQNATGWDIGFRVALSREDISMANRDVEAAIASIRKQAAPALAHSSKSETGSGSANSALVSPPSGMSNLERRIQARDEVYKELRIGELLRFQDSFISRSTRSIGWKLFANAYSEGDDIGMSMIISQQGDEALKNLKASSPVTIEGQVFSAIEVTQRNGDSLTVLRHQREDEALRDSFTFDFYEFVMARRYDRNHPIAQKYLTSHDPVDLLVYLKYPGFGFKRVLIGHGSDDSEKIPLCDYSDARVPELCGEALSDELYELMNSGIESVAEHLRKTK